MTTKAEVLDELHRLYYVKPYEPEVDILKEDLAAALNCDPKHAAAWARKHPDIMEVYNVRLPGGQTAKAYRRILP